MIRTGRPLASLLLGFFLFAVSTSGPGQQTETKSSAQADQVHPVLVELFTSEGCSSCPPADVLLQKLDTLQPIQGARLIVLSEHVTYWDHDGWKDPNSSDVFTERQTSYERTLGVQQPYTPQFIVDGTQEANLSDPRSFEPKLTKAATAPKVAIRIGDVAVDGANPSTLRAHIDTDANFDKHTADMFVALALDHVESQVLHGENGGKHLVHVAVVRQLSKIGKLPKEKTFSQDVQLKLKPGEDATNLRVIVFAQESDGKVLGVAEHK
jgi:hypothetical protein